MRHSPINRALEPASSREALAELRRPGEDIAAQPKKASGESDQALTHPISDQFLGTSRIDNVKGVIEARRLRTTYLADDLFADPAWDILLDLFHSEMSQKPVSVSSLCTASAVPATTALRWIKTMTERGLITRRGDTKDARRVFVELSPSTSEAMCRYFDAISNGVKKHPLSSAESKSGGARGDERLLG